ncbi:hypothetical protein A2450_01910 [candidate division WWE3 bacterium RIFOXYC2_FULL_40_11]|uniref:Uncharacterized protein n=1 Tax=candidate division WWE3 bacterium RIFOXYA2_FULL_46_9 TaxID=1802636 RepID=A0A1F4W338_UNCKA|nr:MAG: hypothetical protein A2264_02660 [candidate division WWE3 bacterium RIFOXYA2_FULL_46_9]OGC64506.1 MAG: hypothetical protein A2326_03855 [candidate division WWE3 bacterium RIFOXYB2_FULL_41_6]OGC67934.1 MAG: hypothetical protein A2450_01910 [candidate division WWE3 bacterium RIFOXYC2_FULL_40_11]OGC70694.1 MAG: hypothetical protein A2602_00135 [candidate division WWE3 bacterium RIFOXYD1_FULL_40_11]HLD50728.1 hypothetical protein [Patescibacteria group bacterium]
MSSNTRKRIVDIQRSDHELIELALMAVAQVVSPEMQVELNSNPTIKIKVGKRNPDPFADDPEIRQDMAELSINGYKVEIRYTLDPAKGLCGPAPRIIDEIRVKESANRGMGTGDYILPFGDVIGHLLLSYTTSYDYLINQCLVTTLGWKEGSVVNYYRQAIPSICLLGDRVFSLRYRILKSKSPISWVRLDLDFDGRCQGIVLFHPDRTKKAFSVTTGCLLGDPIGS